MVAMIAFLSENPILYRNYLTENLEQYYCIPVFYLFVFVLIENIHTFVIYIPQHLYLFMDFIIVLTCGPLSVFLVHECLVITYSTLIGAVVDFIKQEYDVHLTYAISAYISPLLL